MSLEEIADVVDAPPGLVAEYLRIKKESLRKAEERRQEFGEDPCVELRWHETLPILVWCPMEAGIAINLIESDDKVVGNLDPISIQQLLSEGGILPRSPFKLHAAVRAITAGGRLSNWIFPYCNRPVLARARYSAVRMELSMRFLRVAKGNVPKMVTDTAFGRWSAPEPASRATLGSSAAGPGVPGATGSGGHAHMAVSAGSMAPATQPAAVSSAHISTVAATPPVQLAEAAAVDRVASSMAAEVEKPSRVAPPRFLIMAEPMEPLAEPVTR